MTATVLDPCCGGRMMWFNRQDQRALFGDIRSENHTLCDGRAFNITPDLNMDFRAMPFPDESFRLVCFDPLICVTLAGNRGYVPSTESSVMTGRTICVVALRNASASSSPREY